MTDTQKGTVKDFGDFWQRTSGQFIAGLKGAATGAAAEIAAPFGAALPYIGGPLTGWAAKYAAMTNVGTALDGHIAKAQDYLDTATAMLGFHAVSMGTGAVYVGAEKVAGKLGDIYAQTGMHPADVAKKAAKTNPTIMQDIVSDNVTVPEALKSSIDPQFEKPAAITIAPEKDSENGVMGDYIPQSKVEFENVVEPPKEAKAGEGGGVEDITPHPLDNQIVYNTQKPKEKLTFNKLYTQLLDQVDPVHRLESALTEGNKEDLKAIASPEFLLRNARAADEKARAAIVGDGPRDADGNHTGTPSMAAILKPFDGDRKGFTNYLTAAVALDRHGVASAEARARAGAA